MMKLLDGVTAKATLSPCGTYRYTLERHWGDANNLALFVMLNPSTATADQDDPTIRRCQSFARSWGYGGLVVANLFALRATNPKELYSHADPVGPENDATLRDLMDSWFINLVVCAWGNHGEFQNRGDAVVTLIRGRGRIPCALGLTKRNQPKHPLYIKGDTLPKGL
jgi:hypothetical protein